MTSYTPNFPFLLAADIDGTVLGDPQGEGLFREFARQHSGHFTLAYITGRHQESVLELIAQERLPFPRFICSNVGTELFDFEDFSAQAGQAYAARVQPDWSLEQIYQLGQGEGVSRQEFKRGQPRFQAGFNWDARPETLQAFRERLAGLENLYIQASYDTYIDVLPAALGKGRAVEFLQEYLGLPPEWVVVAGDSGNDRQMFETRFNGIVPSNALPELKALACQPWHYHSPYPAALGLLDGLWRFGLVRV
jgi:hydroxymethylpyrimidine pyrophosphatase-like HAD family hydrolase